MSDPEDDETGTGEREEGKLRPVEPDPAGDPADEPKPPDPPALKLERDAEAEAAGEEPVPETRPPEPEPPPPEARPTRPETRPEPQPEPAAEVVQQPTFAQAPEEPPEGGPAPEETPPAETPAGPPATRRGAMARMVGICAALPFAGGALLALRTGLSPIPERIPDRVPLGRPSDVPAQGLLRRAVTFSVRRGPRVEAVTEVVFLTRHRGKVIAFSARCTHQGCPVVTDKQVGENASPSGPPLVCPCHGGKFTATGEPAGGPVEERLPRLRLDLPDSPDGTIQWVRTDE